ncbi:PLP-dependent aminotransferase family protein [Solirubrobacter taibaiensis]|nr:PLP-dependent aminotransferase family protein [Solirubrobacter taibaiensis]
MATISFARGAPSLDIVDVEGLKEASRLAFENDPAGTTAYGTSVGYVPLREWIAEQHGVPVEQVLVTNGSMQADAFLFELLVQPGDAVIVENPTYDRTLLNLRARGADVRFVDLEDDGISIEGLEEVLATAVHPKLAHIIPNFQNPAGYTLSQAKRTRLLELAVEHDFTIFEDDPYVSIRFEGETIPSMFSRDEDGKVVYASSFSKTVCPGIRVGYLLGSQAVIKQIQTIATNTYISPNMVAQSIVNQFARSGRMDGAVETVKTALKARKDAVVAALQREIPEAKFANPSGGYFMWVELPEGVDVAELEKAAGQREVQFVKGTDFGGSSNTLRLAYSGVTPEQIDEGITKLAEALRSLGVAAS